MIAEVVAERAAGREALAALAPLFRYPDAAFPLHLEVASRVVNESNPAAAGALESFRKDLREIDLPDLQSRYTSTFDLAPSCSPYIGSQVFGDAARERARLMVGLRMSYRKSGPEPDEDELPDHLAEVLRFAPYYEGEVWRELGRMVLLPALAKMESLLAPTTNPYRHLMAAARRMSEAAFVEGAAS